MRTLLDIFQSAPRQGTHPEHWLGPASQYPRGYRFGVIGRDGNEHWEVKGRLHRRWVRVG